MSKLVVLKLGEGSFEQGFPITLQLGEESLDPISSRLVYHPLAELSGKLPQNLEIPQLYQNWLSTYRQLNLRSRLGAPATQVTNVSLAQDCQQAAQRLSDSLNHWLQTNSFRPIREKWLEQLSPDESVRVILQTEDILIQQLPWHLWELIERYTKAELALSVPTYERVNRSIQKKQSIKILAILGNSQGIDIEADRRLLERLPDAEVCFLVEPQRQTLNQYLWSQAWDILFFAGHSNSAENHSIGEIKINQTESLTIHQLKYALRNAIEQGLQFAIFNSCDGLGLARNLTDLRIPQLIVMRQPVPDRVAQEFLKSFLISFSQGHSFYRSVRTAREQLQGLEHHFPCATWLPIICQNPAESPLSWQELQGKFNNISSIATQTPVDQKNSARSPQSKSHWLKPDLIKVVLTGLLVTVGVVGVRSLGWLQPLELTAFDQLMRLRPRELPDDRILVVTVDAAERQTYGEDLSDLGRISLADRYLNQLLQQLQQYQPRLIGLDLYRDFPVDASQPSLITQFQTNSKIITVCKARFLGGDSIAPPPNSPAAQVGFSDFVVDDDNTLRRHLLTMTPELIDPDIPCTTPYAFSMLLAARYLQAQNISVTLSPNSTWQVQDVSVSPLQPSSGGYWQADTQGSQILLNYRMTEKPANQVSLTAVVTGQVNPEIVRDRIVLIGVVGETNTDVWQTPIDPQMPGVMAQAHMISQLLSTALDGRSLLWVWSDWGEFLWIAVWAMIGSGLGWCIRSPMRLGIFLILVSGTLSGICWIILIQAGWVPLIPSIFALTISSCASLIYSIWKKVKKKK